MEKFLPGGAMEEFLKRDRHVDSVQAKVMAVLDFPVRCWRRSESDTRRSMWVAVEVNMDVRRWFAVATTNLCPSRSAQV